MAAGHGRNPRSNLPAAERAAEGFAADESTAQAVTAKDLSQGGDKVTSAPLWGAKGAEKLVKTVPQTPSISQDIDHLLSHYMSELTNLGPEYGQEMEFLKPYLNPQPESLNQVIAQSQANATPTGNAAVNKADAALAQAADSMKTPGFGNLAAAAKSYEQSIPYQDVLQAGLGYQKYLQTYGGQQVPTGGWPSSVQQAYQAITGSSGASPGGGLPGLSSAAAGANATNIANTIAQQLSGTTQGGSNQ